MAKKRGRIFQRGSIYWIQYWFNGADRRESTGSHDRRLADKLLTQRLAGKDTGQLVVAALKPLRFEDLCQELAQDYRLNNQRSLDRAQDALKALGSRFAGWKTSAITESQVKAYMDQRVAEGRAKATIQYELRILKRAFHLAKLPCPSWPLLRIHNVRKDFFTPEQAQAVIAHLPEYLQPAMQVAFLLGWRCKSEVLPMQWSWIDWKQGIVTLPMSKNGESRVYPFTLFPELAALFRAQRRVADQLEWERSVLIPWVFFRVTHTTVLPLRSYKTAWVKACVRAGLPGRWVHDFRRCGARSLRQAGIPESVAMKLLGHKTRSVFERYNIIDDTDLRVGVAQLAKYHAQQAAHPGLQDTLRDNQMVTEQRVTVLG